MAVIEKVANWIKESRKIVGFTGAGISTNSGIPDFRSPHGVWSKNRTVTFQEFVENRSDRIEYWRQKLESWPDIRDARPNSGHLFFTKLEQQGRLLGLITQNIDGLHTKSGLSKEKIIQLHGWTNTAACLSCGAEISMDKACELVKNKDPAPVCQECSGLLKPATISFGQSLRKTDLDQAASWSAKCDLFIAVGSSLVVQPAAGFPLLARQNGARLVIVNHSTTPLDKKAGAVIREDISEVFQKISDLM